MKKRPLLALINKIQDKYLLSIKYRRIWIKFIKLFIPFFYDSNHTKNVELLQNNGFVVLNPIKKDIIHKIKKIAETNYLIDPWNMKNGCFLKKDRPLNVTTAFLKNPGIFPEIQSLALNHDSLRLAASYFNCKCVIDSVDVWWSFPTDNDPFEAEKFHRDRDSSEFLKWFVYLTDVNQFNGPHEYALDSLNSKHFTKGGRYEDDSIYEFFSTKKFLGCEGTNFLENTYGLHRGYKPQEGERLLFQVRYSIHGSSFRYREEKLKRLFIDDALRFSYIN